MTKLLLMGISAFAMMTGVALAQSSSSDTTTSTTTTTTAPVAPTTGSYSSSNYQKTIDSSGTETNKNQSYTSGVNGSDAKSSTQTTAPDGSKLSTHEERIVTPHADTTTTNRTTSTTTGQ